MKGKYLSEIIDIDEIGCECINLINAPCGSGKTTFICEEIARLVREDYWKQSDEWGNCKNILYLIDTRNGKEQLLKRGSERLNILGDSYWVIDNITVMTYAGYATLLKNAPEKDQWKENAVIVLDEFHNCIKYSAWERNNIHELALSYIHDRAFQYGNILIALSATADNIIEKYEWASGFVRIIELKEEARHYEEVHTENYYNLTQLLNQIKPNEKGIVYIPHVSDIIKYQNILRDKGIRVGSFWSVNNTDHIMTDEQKALREYILDTQRIPDNIDVLFINKSSETSINITSHIDFMVIHTSDKDTQIQARGRYRNDLDRLYLYDEEAFYDEKIIIPSEWLNKRLKKPDIDELIKILNVKDESRHLVKKPTFIKWIELDGYTVQEIKSNGQRYTIINK